MHYLGLGNTNCAAKVPEGRTLYFSVGSKFVRRYTNRLEKGWSIKEYFSPREVSERTTTCREPLILGHDHLNWIQIYLGISAFGYIRLRGTHYLLSFYHWIKNSDRAQKREPWEVWKWSCLFPFRIYSIYSHSWLRKLEGRIDASKLSENWIK